MNVCGWAWGAQSGWVSGVGRKSNLHSYNIGKWHIACHLEWGDINPHEHSSLCLPLPVLTLCDWGIEASHRVTAHTSYVVVCCLCSTGIIEWVEAICMTHFHSSIMTLFSIIFHCFNPNKGNHGRLQHLTIQSSHSTSVSCWSWTIRDYCLQRWTRTVVCWLCMLLDASHPPHCVGFQFKQSMEQSIRPVHCTLKGPNGRLYGYTHAKQYTSCNLHIKRQVLDVNINLHFIHPIRPHCQNHIPHQHKIGMVKSRCPHVSTQYCLSQVLQTQWLQCRRGSLQWCR